MEAGRRTSRRALKSIKLNTTGTVAQRRFRGGGGSEELAQDEAEDEREGAVDDQQDADRGHPGGLVDVQAFTSLFVTYSWISETRCFASLLPTEP